MAEELRVLNKSFDYFDAGTTVYVGRPSVYGNPFKIGEYGREGCIRKYEEMLLSSPALMLSVREKLKGKNLMCWCSPKACHADVLMKYANEERG